MSAFFDNFKQWGVNVQVSFIKSNTLKDFVPCTTCKGLIFNEKNELLIIKEGKDGGWNLPGGTIDSGENPLTALIREVDEEADVDLKDINLFGARKHVYDKEPVFVEELRREGRFPKTGLFSFHLLYFAKIKKLKTQTIDPHYDQIIERKFIKPEQFLDYMPWGSSSKVMIKEIIKEL